MGPQWSLAARLEVGVAAVLPLQVQGWAGVGAPGGQLEGSLGRVERGGGQLCPPRPGGSGCSWGPAGGPWEDGAGRGSAVTSASLGRAECIVCRGVAGRTWAQLPGSPILCDLRAQVPTRVPGPVTSTFQMQRRTLCPGQGGSVRVAFESLLLLTTSATRT